MHQVEISVISGPSQGDVFRFPLNPSNPVSLGRAAQNLLVIADTAAGAEHAQIVLRDGKAYLVDLGSAGGTWLMGFQVPAGEAGLVLEDNDEFKIGEVLLRVSLRKEDEDENAVAVDQKTGQVRGRRRSRKWMSFMLGAAALLLLLLFWQKRPPAAQSDKLLNFTESRLIGFFSDKRAGRDLRHPLRARFALPVRDQLIEFETLNAGPLSVFVDSAPLMRIPASRGPIWQKWQFIVPDAMSGAARAFVVENTGVGKNGKRIEKWAMRYARNSVLFDVPAAAMLEHARGSYDDLLVRAVADLRGMNLAAGGMFNTLRSIQRLIVLALLEQRLVGIGYAIDLDRQLPALELLTAKLEQLQRERGANGRVLTAEQRDRHLSLLLELAGQLDSELWRRFFNRRAAAMLAVKTKNYGEALRDLLSLQNMFPAVDEYRRKKVERMLNDKKIIPKAVMRKKNKYLRRQ